MSNVTSYVAFFGIVAGSLLNGPVVARSQVAVSPSATSSSAQQSPDTPTGSKLPKSTQAVCEKFYGTIDSKEKNAALKNSDATVAAIEQVKVILKERDAEVLAEPTWSAIPTLDEAERKIDKVIPDADRSWYALIRKNRYDYGHQYAPVCPAATD